MKKELIQTTYPSLLTVLLLLLMPMGMAADRADSLRQVIATATGEARENAYKELNTVLQAEGRGNEQLALLEEWVSYERQKGDVKKEGDLRWHKIALLSNLGLDDAMLAEAPVQMAWFEEHGQWENYYNTWESKASSYLYSQKPQTALREAGLMLADAQQRDNDFGRVVSYILTGLTFQSMHQNDAAITNLTDAYRLLKDGGMETPSLFISVCDYLSQTLDDNGEYERELALTGEWQQTIEQQRRKKANGPAFMAGTTVSCHVQRASAQMGLGRFDEAEDELNRAEEALEYMNIPLTRFRVSFSRARLLMKKGQYEQALERLDSLKAMGLEAGGNIDILRAGALMELGRYQEAAGIYQKEFLQQDSVFGSDMRTQLGELATLYQIDESRIKARLQRNHFIIAIIAIVLVALLIILYLNYHASKRLGKKNRELEEANERLVQANERVEDSAKMKMDFIKNISHEIRTPLNILSGFTQVITTPGISLPPEQLADIHKRINENTERIVKLTNRLLELSDSNSHAPLERADRVTAGKIVADAISETGIRATADVAFEWDAGDTPASTLLVTHRKYAVLALGCLLDNAQKFTKEGMIAVRLVERGTQLHFAVEDTGIGVQADQSERIFEEFVQLDNYSVGTGIGLTVARSIVRRLGGDIHLDTTYSAGARFVMTLPTTPPASASAPRSS